MRARSPHHDDDRGVVLVLFAISVTMIFTLVALVLGSSLGYSAVRNAQNAVDAAAAAATTTLESVRQGTEGPAAVLATAVAVAEDNGATPGSVRCDVVTAHYAITRAENEVIGPCTAANVGSSSAAGIRISASDVRDVPFAAFVDQRTISATASATATIQPVRYASIRSPFLVCATAEGHGTPLLTPDPSGPGGWHVNHDAFGLDIQLWANGNEMRDGGRSCGAPNWHGLADTTVTRTVPSTDPDDPEDWWPIESGSKVGWIPEVLAGSEACDGVVRVGCKLLLPLCSTGDGNGINFRMYCPAMAVFEVTYAGDGPSPCSASTHAICGRMTTGGAPLRGRGVADTPQITDLTRVRLVE